MLVEENQMEKKGVPALLMTILGLSLAGNIVYLFTVGSTHFTVAEIYSVLLFLYLIATKRIDWYRIASVIGIEFQLLCVIIIMSGIFAFITFMNVGLIYRYVVGIISFAICCTT